MEIEACEDGGGFDVWSFALEASTAAIWEDWDVKILNPLEADSNASRIDEIYQTKRRAACRGNSKLAWFNQARFMTASSRGNVNASAGVQVDISLGGGKEKAEINVSAKAEMSDNRGNSVSVGANHNTNTQETNISIGANASIQSESPGQRK